MGPATASGAGNGVSLCARVAHYPTGTPYPFTLREKPGGGLRSHKIGLISKGPFVGQGEGQGHQSCTLERKALMSDADHVGRPANAGQDLHDEHPGGAKRLRDLRIITVNVYVHETEWLDGIRDRLQRQGFRHSTRSELVRL